MPKKKLQKNTTDQPKFKPTPGMRVWLDSACELMTDNKSKIADHCGVDRSNWYDWVKKSGFEDWFYSNWKKNRRRLIPKLDEIGMQKADEDFNYWKTMRQAAEPEPVSDTKVLQVGNFFQNLKKSYDLTDEA